MTNCISLSHWSVLCWQRNKKYVNWKATLSKTEQILEETWKFSSKFLNKSKYSSRMRNKIKIILLPDWHGCAGEWECLWQLCFAVSDMAEQWKRFLCWALYIYRLYHSHIILTCCVKDAQAGFRRQCRDAALGSIICITRSVQLSSLLRNRGFTSPRGHLYSLWFESKCGRCLFSVHFGKHCGKNLCLSRSRIAVGLIVWESGSKKWPLILLKSYYSRQHTLSHMAGRLETPLDRSSDWGILAVWCNVLSLKLGWGNDGEKPSQI